MKLPDVRLMLTCKCEQASYFASESLDRPLSFSERWAGRLHDMVCRNCRRVTRQLRWLHRVLAQMPADIRRNLVQQASRLSPSGRRRIKARLRAASTDEA